MRTPSLEFPRGTFVLRLGIGHERVNAALYSKESSDQVVFAICEYAELRVESRTGVWRSLWLGDAAFEVSAEELQRVATAVSAFRPGTEIKGMRGDAA